MADLYTQWLGVRAGPRPPEHYELLGLPRFCKDADRIERAAREALAKLDKYQLVPDRARQQMLQKMITEVAKARMCLVDPRRRAAYDKTLDVDYGFEDQLRQMPDMEVLDFEGLRPGGSDPKGDDEPEKR
jgi:DnaJ-class molecular chaperone